MKLTIREAIDRVDAMRPNTVADTEKYLWLAQLDGALRRQVHDQHEPVPEDDCAGADIAQEEDSVLLAKEPYSGMYLYWLMAQIDLALGELARYNNDMMLYNMALTEYAVDYKKTHIPAKRGQFQL